MKLPKGEHLLLTIDRVVERECDDCDANGFYSSPDACPYPSYWHPEYTCRSDCDEGQRKVRVRGWVEVGRLCSPSASNPFYGIEVKGYRGEGGTRHLAETALIAELTAAYRDGSLPPEIAANMEESDEEVK